MTSTYECVACKFSTTLISNWKRHEVSKKHVSRNQTEDVVYSCNVCNKIYKDRTGLWRHSKTCKTPDNMTALTNMVIELVKSNNDLQKQVLELCKGGTHVTNHNNNKSFNINLYLTEQCKDAINFSDFIKSIEVSHQDLENNAQLGFVNGISKIILDNLKQLSVNERPIHCTDLKRETMYIKDEDKWTKEENDTKLNNAIQAVSRKSIGKLLEWKGENDEYNDMDSKFSGLCIVIQRNSMAGYDRAVFYPKVIHAIAREILVAK